MSELKPSGLVDRLMGICFTLLGAAIALFCAVKVVQAILPFLIFVIGTVALVWVGVLVYRLWREKW